ncbi:hypothetical protein MBAV_000917, partial [Candidatus Magnetobacterium bavaricum]
SLTYPADSINSSITWHGNNLGSGLLVSTTGITVKTSGVGAGTITYTTHYDAYSFTVTPKTTETYPVVVLVQENP